MEVWGESKRLAISHRRYNEFYKFRGDLLEDLGKEGLHDEVRRPQALFRLLFRLLFRGLQD